MHTVKNTCIKCKETWNVRMTRHVTLNSTDTENIEKHGQLYSICEDCNEHGNDCYSVYKEEMQHVR